MITLLYGTNSFAARQALQEIANDFSPEEIERFEGDELVPERLSEVLMGASLFSSKKLVVVRQASEQKALWSALAEWVEKVPVETRLVLLESTPDKRTKTFKLLQKHGDVRECKELSEAETVRWVLQQLPEMPRDVARFLAERVGTDQWQLSQEVEKLALSGDVSQQSVERIVEATPQAQVFVLLDAALAGKTDEVQQRVAECVGQEDPYKFFGLLAQQVFQLTVMRGAGRRTPEEVAKDIGAHPYPLKKLHAQAQRMSQADVARLVELVAKLDMDMKRSGGEPWLLLERTLVMMGRR